MNGDEELWKPVPGWPELLAGDQGHIRRVAYEAVDGKIRRAKNLQPQRRYAHNLKALTGYVRVKRQNRIHDLSISDLIASAWFPDFDSEFHTVAFVNKDPTDTRPANLIILPKLAVRVAKKLGLDEPAITTRQGEPA